MCRVDQVRLKGHCLHAGCSSAITLACARGPVAFEWQRRSVPLSRLGVVRTDEGVTLADDTGLRVDLVEHLLAALGGMGVHEGLRVMVDGPELPLLDGGALRYVEALNMLGLVSPCGEREISANPARLRVRKNAEIQFGDACYQFCPGQNVHIEVTIVYAHPAIGTQRAEWNGGQLDFASRIAPARTFGFVEDLAGLNARNRALGAASQLQEVLAALLVFDGQGVVPTGLPAAPNEPATHKLLDLIGDLYFYGGPPVGSMIATRPGHTATHEVIRRALYQGIVGV